MPRRFARFSRNAAGVVVGVALWHVAWFAVLETRLAGAVYADFGISATVYIVGTILSSLFGMFGGRKVDPQIGRAVEGLRQGVTNLGRELANVASRLGAAIVAGLQAVGRFFQRSFGPLLKAIGNMWGRIIRTLDRIFGPIINFLRRLRDEILRFYEKFIKPIVDAIEIVRRVLHLLSLFGVSWAKKLDEKLYDLERLFLAPIELLVTKINEALGWINRIVTLDGLVQRVVLIQSAWRDVNYLTSQWWARLHKPATPFELAQYRAVPEITPIEAVAGELGTYIATGRGELQAEIDEHVADVFITARGVRRGGLR